MTSFQSFKSIPFVLLCVDLAVVAEYVVKAMDLKSIGVSPRRFDSCRLGKMDVDFGFGQRMFFLLLLFGNNQNRKL